MQGHWAHIKGIFSLFFSSEFSHIHLYFVSHICLILFYRYFLSFVYVPSIMLSVIYRVEIKQKINNNNSNNNNKIFVLPAMFSMFSHHPKSICPIWWYLGSWKLIRTWRWNSHEWDWYLFVTKRPQRAPVPFPLCEEYNENSTTLTLPCWHPNIRLPASRTVIPFNFFISHTVCYSFWTDWEVLLWRLKSSEGDIH